MQAAGSGKGALSLFNYCRGWQAKKLRKVHTYENCRKKCAKMAFEGSRSRKVSAVVRGCFRTIWSVFRSLRCEVQILFVIVFAMKGAHEGLICSRYKFKAGSEEERTKSHACKNENLALISEIWLRAKGTWFGHVKLLGCFWGPLGSCTTSDCCWRASKGLRAPSKGAFYVPVNNNFEQPFNYYRRPNRGKMR